MSQLDLPSEALTGRTRELGFLQGFVRETAVSGGALILSGDPGMGKTALLNAVVGSAVTSGMTVLRVAGLEFEGEVGFSSLNQALFPLSATSAC
jgi:DNA helicase TIP49 (TBP-interacting protein)